MSEKVSKFPYKSLGDRLKKMRGKRKESLAEVSGAVEIDIDVLASIEEGKERPSEDILMLLISYFAVQEDEAVQLWELAGYDQKQPSQNKDTQEDEKEPYATVMVMPMDARVVYTDMVNVTANEYGVVMNFMQTAGPSNQPLAVSRIGMSREHAERVLELLKSSLKNIEPKSLPAPKKSSKRSDKKDQ